MSIYYDKSGAPIDMLTWASLFEDHANRQIARTVIGDVCVSTVWLGMNHSFGSGPPLIFETMVFGGALDEECERYHTEAEALHGHEEMVKRAGGGPR